MNIKSNAALVQLIDVIMENVHYNNAIILCTMTTKSCVKV